MRIYSGLFMVVAFAGALSWGTVASGEVFNRNIDYDVYYEVSTFEVDTLERIKITGVATIGEKAFLSFQSATPGLGSKDRAGFILLDSVRAIIPSDISKPRRAFAPVN